MDLTFSLVVMIMRVYALYERKVWVLILYVAVAVCTVSIAIVSHFIIAEGPTDMTKHSGRLRVAQKAKNLRWYAFRMVVGLRWPRTSMENGSAFANDD